MSFLLLKIVGIDRLKYLAQKYIFFEFLFKYVVSSNNSYIGKNAKWKSCPNFPHGIKSVFISGDSKIGDNVTIFQEVTIGSNTLIDSKKKGAPEIGDNVFIGAGAKLIGDIKIGKNARIGANATVVKDVPPNTLVVPQKAKFIERKKTMDNTLYKKNGNNEWEKLINGNTKKVTDHKKIKALKKYDEA